jgi:hypothetical protein
VGSPESVSIYFAFTFQWNFNSLFVLTAGLHDNPLDIARDSALFWSKGEDGDFLPADNSLPQQDDLYLMFEKHRGD